LQPAARHHGERADFADHRGDAGSAQPLLHHPQDLGVTRCPDQHETRGVEPVSGEAGPVEVRAGKAPQHHAVPRFRQPIEDAGGKGSGERAVFLVTPRPEDFVQGPPGEPAARQYPVDNGYPER